MHVVGAAAGPAVPPCWVISEPSGCLESSIARNGRQPREELWIGPETNDGDRCRVLSWCAHLETLYDVCRKTTKLPVHYTSLAGGS